MKTKRILVSVGFLSTMFFLFASLNTLDQEKWVAPKSADAIINPLKGDANAATSGKKLFRAMCSVCHGVKGKGDGIGGAGLAIKPTDLTSAEFHSQTDGAIFWKIAEGRTPMTSYRNSIPEKMRWQIINYLRTLKK